MRITRHNVIPQCSSNRAHGVHMSDVCVEGELIDVVCEGRGTVSEIRTYVNSIPSFDKDEYLRAANYLMFIEDLEG